MFHAPERLRVLSMSSPKDGNHGVFIVGSPIGNRQLRVISSDGMGWEHVSVSLPRSAPTWEEMCFVKGLWWDEEDVVMQLHPRESEYVNHHQHCLHLWRPTILVIPEPPTYMVGPKTKAE